MYQVREQEAAVAKRQGPAPGQVALHTEPEAQPCREPMIHCRGRIVVLLLHFDGGMSIEGCQAGKGILVTPRRLLRPPLRHHRRQ